MTYGLLKRYDEALVDLRRGPSSFAPKDAGRWANRGVTYRLMERYDKALVDLSRGHRA